MHINKHELNKDEFYIGWKLKTPSHNSRFLLRSIIFLFIFIAGVAIILAISQKKSGTGTFEFGRLTDVKGIYLNLPVPLLKVISGRDISGKFSFITIPLVGYGKHGAGELIARLEKEKKVSLDQKELTFRGTLIYNDGKTFLQVDETDKPLINIANNVVSRELLPRPYSRGIQKIKGQIVDPKCYFGVMKPGEGKPHRDCAVRCILGGIPPVLVARNSKGESNYYLVIGANGENAGEQVQDYVAEPVELQAEVVEYDDWMVLYLTSKNSIRRISGLSLVKNDNEIAVCR